MEASSTLRAGAVELGFDAPAPLTPREIDVVRLLSRGCSYSQIADRLGISVHTVTSHIKNSYRKLEVRTAAAAVMRAVELRLLGPRLLTPNQQVEDRMPAVTPV
jgi:DNA-binding CsgD family transcriptional regulator